MTSSDDDKISPDDLVDAIRVVDIAELASWDRSPVDYDVGMITVQAGEFGQLQPVIAHQGTVLFDGGESDAERVDPKHGGRLAVFDLPVSWSRQRAEAAALALLTRHRQGLWDDGKLAELVTGLHVEMPEIAAAAGWDGDALDELLVALEPFDDGETAGGGAPGGSDPCPACGRPF